MAISLLILTAGASRAQNIYSALHHGEIREYTAGKPERIVETNTFFGSVRTQIDKNIKMYDHAGMLQTEERYDETGKMTAKLSYINDTINHRSVKRVFERWTAVGYTKETANYTYDQQGLLTRVTDVDASDRTIRVTELTNDDKGHPVELHLYDGDGQSFGTEKAVYSYGSNKVITSVFSNDGRRLSGDTMNIQSKATGNPAADEGNYNEHGDALSYTSRMLDGTVLLYEMEYIYDGKGNCTDEKIYKVTSRSNGRKKRKLDRHFEKQITYRPE